MQTVKAHSRKDRLPVYLLKKFNLFLKLGAFLLGLGTRPQNGISILTTFIQHCTVKPEKEKA